MVRGCNIACNMALECFPCYTLCCRNFCHVTRYAASPCPSRIPAFIRLSLVSVFLLFLLAFSLFLFVLLMFSTIIFALHSFSMFSIVFLWFSLLFCCFSLSYCFYLFCLSLLFCLFLYCSVFLLFYGGCGGMLVLFVASCL